ncbi:outer membrane protein assembly factor BamB family protein [Nocardioides luteus]|uniref:outer membrane protein assembly factor BamB family protein n=1 Tax=Nocardioides luteus TaxID=1844 RepID=UPI0018CB148F|nr:PQQ-binding-like beta-propeller repeat protein [Nocardioides luteus]MBG6097491.1 outer membrane protein assembly factor BamB [Nocardioides luteus]
MAVSSGAKKALVSVGVLVCVGALLVGIGHWRAHDLVSGDVVWHVAAEDSGDEAVVVRDRIYTYDNDLLTIRDLESGKEVAEEYQDGAWAYVGDGGHVAVVGNESIAMYDRDGEDLWHLTMDDLYLPIAISRDGTLDAIACSEESRCVAAQFDVSGRVTSRDSRGSTDLWTPALIGVDTFEDHPSVRRVPTIATGIDPKKRAAFQVRDGEPFGPAVEVTDDVAAQVGDLLVGMSRKDGTCHFTATRAGKRAWTTSTPCPDLGYPKVEVFTDRIYVTNPSGDAYDVVTADLEGRRATSFRIKTGPTSEEDRTQLSPTPDAIVLTLTDQIAAYSPTTGKRLWSQKLSRTSHDALDEAKKIYPGVEVSGPVIDRYGNGPQALATLAIGRDVPAYTHTYLDATSGEESAELAAPYGVSSLGLEDGRVLVLGDDDIWLVAG